MKSISEKIFQTIFILFLICLIENKLVAQQNTMKVYPTESDELLLNPGIGFTTFQRFNGDTLNSPFLKTVISFSEAAKL